LIEALNQASTNGHYALEIFDLERDSSDYFIEVVLSG
jgi:hypothetical protein